ncbi:hypothetical protein J2T09_001738 [Neorhizobium huautlense]|uniref:Uncharacterized protein n=1 Tax=Neorhizobium huautlense TaxID=67774 RepID=A0ABT9PR89_9HYPH|nr:hypothetical protein [Neorhizobium huautlense]MDP9836986.1 hypothetical protein [Neorhizobium huautlense]
MIPLIKILAASYSAVRNTATCQHATIELFAEDTLTAQNDIAPEPTRHDRQLNSPIT